ncbi:MAG: PAS domain S-box protein [Desulfovibrionaceae bacterium]|nr:PAS domain S-box protein [Desulfovibrionaceae bacterium]MBF0513678.1 PAS domain S-box protein [Desulfovibrionaceae bacterium]
MSDSQDGLVLSCDFQGRILRVFHDSTGIFGPGLVGRELSELVDQSMLSKLESFVSETRRKGSTFSWELTMLWGDRYEVMNFFGLVKHGSLCIIISKSPQNIFSLYDEMLEIINEQGAQLRALQQTSSIAQRVTDPKALDEFMKLNNELVNEQRELSLSNARLAQQEARFRKIIQENPDLILVLNKRGQLLFLNDAAQSFLGIAPQELIGTGLSPIFLIKGGEEIDLRDKDGVFHTMDPREVEAIWDDKPARLIYLRDITERKQIEILREDIDRISRHDLKTPLNGIISFPQLLLMDDNLTEEQRQIIEMIQDSGYRMLDLINLSLHLFQMEIGSYEPTLAPVDILPVLRSVLVELRSPLEQKDTSVDVFLSNSPVKEHDSFVVMGEEILCHSILSNLVKNAIEASSPGKTISIYFDQNSWRTVRVLNSGEIPPEFLDRFFEKYATHGKKGGTGLGTYSAKLMIKTMGGDLELDVSAPGQVAVIARWPVAPDVK